MGRNYSASVVIENGFVHIPETASWFAEYLHEMTVFPNGKHDDQADSTAQFLDWFKKPFASQGIFGILPPACGSRRAAEQTTTHQNRTCARFDGMVRRAGERRGEPQRPPRYLTPRSMSGDTACQLGFPCATESSNPAPSSAESATNLVAAGGVARGWDPEFESALLQQPVCLSSEP
jgi:hypothetical protein